MNIEEVRDLDVEWRLIYWIQERERIRERKEQGADKPWTDDEILQSYRFCNVRRMDDVVSKWILHNWYLPHLDHPQMLAAAAAARFFNKPESLALITDHIFKKGWRPDRIVATLRKHRDKGNKVFNGAYMVRGNDGMDKIDCVINHYISHLFKKKRKRFFTIELDTSSMQESHKRVNAKYGFGSFMAGQIVADLRFALTGKWSDREWWAPVGPGSARGVSRLYGEEPTKNGITQEEFEGRLQWVIEFVDENLPQIGNRLEAIDYQNCLCEWDKYERLLWDQGRVKQRYPGQGSIESVTD